MNAFCIKLVKFVCKFALLQCLSLPSNIGPHDPVLACRPLLISQEWLPQVKLPVGRNDKLICIIATGASEFVVLKKRPAGERQNTWMHKWGSFRFYSQGFCGNVRDQLMLPCHRNNSICRALPAYAYTEYLLVIKF